MKISTVYYWTVLMGRAFSGGWGGLFCIMAGMQLGDQCAPFFSETHFNERDKSSESFVYVHLNTI